MGGIAKKAMSFTPVGLVAGALKKSGDKAEEDWQNQYNALGGMKRPEDITRESRLDQSGLMKDVYRLKGPEAWKQAALEQSKLGQVAQAEKAVTQAAGAEARARSALASKGGLMGGAAERLAKASMQNQLAVSQDAARQAQMEQADIEKEAAKQTRDVEKYNIESALQEKNAGEAFQQQQYQQKMNEWAAQKQAQATFGAGKGKGQSGGIVGGAAKLIGK